jgi:hypothetical protein
MLDISWFGPLRLRSSTCQVDVEPAKRTIQRQLPQKPRLGTDSMTDRLTRLRPWQEGAGERKYRRRQRSETRSQPKKGVWRSNDKHMHSGFQFTERHDNVTCMLLKILLRLVDQTASHADQTASHVDQTASQN